ncbi:hypothetical protein [Kitasatospora cathayae]|uniref:Type II secretion system protein GspF domain-containing protein n=1 Tax=Kitasatospora cathayae TaxID=3004092 RepID=A0ABY7QJS9_9ACTN|nr:hypothetical protein [Kitasatospora sp. HUAS 3-15]WBP92169.1 hypothetical protein O1G21_41215 [Kitasatospora sp. HUAS 3-15]
MIDWLMRANYRLSNRTRHKAHRSACERTEELGRSFQVIGLTEPVPNAMRRALWEYAYGWRKFGRNLLRCALTLIILFAAVRGALRLTRLTFPPALPAMRVVVVLVALPVLFVVCGSLMVSSSSVGWLGIASRFTPVRDIGNVLNSCAAVLAASPRTRPELLTKVSNELRYVEQEILKMYRRRKTVPWRSHRWPQLRKHARLVAARLRKAEAGFDTDAEGAAREIARLLVEVADNYVAGRVGALLPEEELKELQPVRDHAALILLWLQSLVRIVVPALVVAAFALAGIWAASKFGVPPGVAALPAIALAGVLAPALVSVVTPQAK